MQVAADVALPRVGSYYVGERPVVSVLRVVQLHGDDQLDDEVAPRVGRGREHEGARAFLQAVAQHVREDVLEVVRHLDLEEPLLLGPHEEQRLPVGFAAELQLGEERIGGRLDRLSRRHAIEQDDAQVNAGVPLEPARRRFEGAVMLVVGGSIDVRDLARLEGGVGDDEAAQEESGEDGGECAKEAQRKSSAQRWS